VTNRVMLFVPDVAAAVSFYERAFGAVADHVDDDGSYGEVGLGGLALAFVAEWHARAHLRSPFRPNSPEEMPPGLELYVEVDDLDAALMRAETAGATLVGRPEDKPWGRRVAFVRDRHGVLVEIAAPT
jgi:lactoylglutathione lyase